MTLMIIYRDLKKSISEFEYFIDQEMFDDDEDKKYQYDLLFNDYVLFLDEFSNCVDHIIQNSKDSKLIDEALKLYFKFHEDYFKYRNNDNCNIEFINDLINDMKLFPDILDYNYDELIICEVCAGNGDIPDCIACGKSSI